MLRSRSNIMLYGVREYIEPTSIPKYINQLDKPYIYHPILRKRKRVSNAGESLQEFERIYYIDICRFKRQILPEGFPKSPVIGWAGLVDMADRGGIRYQRGFPGATFKLVGPYNTYIEWRNKTGIPIKMDMNIDMTKPASYRYNCQNEYVSFNGFCILREEKGKSLNGLNAIDLPPSKYEYPIIIQDCTFYKDGYFKDSGDVILVNGRVWPNLYIKRRQYRFYIMNGCVSRYLNLRLSNEMSITVIGRDRGLLDSPEEKKKSFWLPVKSLMY